MNRRSRIQGKLDSQLLIIFGLLFLIVVISGISVWFFNQYNDLNKNFNNKVTLAVSEAKRDQAEKDQAEFIEREKEPRRELVGPDDFGRLSLKYPKTWSVYIANDGELSGKYLAYLNPQVVPPINSKSARFALIVSIENAQYDKVLSGYQKLIEKGDLTSKAVTVNGHDGSQLEGQFTKDLRSTAVFFKVRDKTIMIQTQADTFKKDFEEIIKTVNFNG